MQNRYTDKERKRELNVLEDTRRRWGASHREFMSLVYDARYVSWGVMYRCGLLQDVGPHRHWRAVWFGLPVCRNKKQRKQTRFDFL